MHLIVALLRFTFLESFSTMAVFRYSIGVWLVFFMLWLLCFGISRFRMSDQSFYGYEITVCLNIMLEIWVYFKKSERKSVEFRHEKVYSYIEIFFTQ